MIADTLDWHTPGTGVYTGTYQEWVQRLPEPQRGQMATLVAKVAARQYDAVVYADRDSIRDASGATGYRYAPDIIFMASGSKGVVYRDVSRAKWKPSQLESGMVFCVQDMCAVRWSVCNNWSIIFREGAPEPYTSRITFFEQGYVVPPDAPPATKEPGGEPGSPVPYEPDAPGYSYPIWGGGYGGGGYSFIGGGGGGGYIPCPRCEPEPYCQPILAPVPDPATWVTLAAGLLLLLTFRRKKS